MPKTTRKKPLTIPARVAKLAATRYAETIYGCHETDYMPGSDRPLIGWAEKGKGHTAAVARAAWVHHYGRQLKAGEIIRAVCGSTRCVRRGHLLLADRSQSQHASKSKRARRDEWPL